MIGTVYAFRRKKVPDESGAFLVYEFTGADISNEDWKQSVSIDICAETRGKAVGDPVFMWRSPNA